MSVGPRSLRVFGVTLILCSLHGCELGRPFQVEITEKYFEVRVSPAVKLPPFYIAKFITFWSFGMTPNGPDRSCKAQK